MIDVIIPVYNTPLKDLERCLNSVLNQTFLDYKVYIIDDGSKEDIRLFLDDYVKEKENFYVKHIINKGVSNARNIGIDISKSKYITFIDSDDTIENNFFSEAYNIMEENNLDIIIGGYNEIKNNNIIKVRLSEPGLHIYENNNKMLFLKKLLSSKTDNTNKEISNCPIGRIYTRLFKRSSIGNLRFNTNIHISEDTLFMIDYSYQVNRIGIVNKVWYNYYKNNYSLSNNTKKEYIESFIREIENRMNKENNNILKNAYQARITKAISFMEEIHE